MRNRNLRHAISRSPAPYNKLAMSHKFQANEVANLVQGCWLLFHDVPCTIRERVTWDLKPYAWWELIQLV